MGRNKFAAVVWPAGDIIIIIIIIIFIYRTRAEHKIQKLNSVYKSTEGYQRSYSSLTWPPMLIKQNYLA